MIPRSTSGPAGSPPACTPARHPPDTRATAERLVSSFDKWAARTDGLVSAASLREARTVAATAIELGAIELAPSHRDNSPRNWVVDADGHTRLIDCGSADYDPWCADPHRLHHREWIDRPDLQEAFLAGYGRPLDAGARILLRAYDAWAAVSTVGWATEHSAQAFADDGRRWIADVLTAS